MKLCSSHIPNVALLYKNGVHFNLNFKNNGICTSMSKLKHIYLSMIQEVARVTFKSKKIQIAEKILFEFLNHICLEKHLMFIKKENCSA